MSETIYARVPDQVKAAAEDYAATNGLTLAAAIATLMDRGLQATADEVSIAQLQEQSAELRAEVKSLREREQAASSASQALAQRIGQPVGSCPKCATPISGHDLLVSGRCPNPDCSASLTPLLGSAAPDKSGKGGLDSGDLNVLLGALGLALAIGYLSQQGGG